MSGKEYLMIIIVVLFGMAVWAVSQQDWTNAGIAAIGTLLVTVVLLVWECVSWIVRKSRKKRAA